MADTPYRIGRGWAGRSRPAAFAIVAIAYSAAILVALAVVVLLQDSHPLVAFFWADIAATVVIFAASMLLANSSLYDPYWSVAPPLIIGGMLIWHLSEVDGSSWTLRHLAMLLLVLIWAVRLTGNWATGWTGLGHEDWRYIQMRNDTRGRLPWWVVSFVGVQLVPTLVVFAALLPTWPAIIGERPFGVLDVLAILVMAGAIFLEATADRQMRAFAADPANRGRTVDVGLWRHSRHPNYLGEISFWWGLWLFGLAAAPAWWWTGIGPLIMVALFLGVSIPLMERRSLARRTDFAAYKENVPVLVPWPRK